MAVIIKFHLSASNKIHASVLSSLAQGSVFEFFDKMPTGRILNKFQKDLAVVDDNLIFELESTLESFFAILGNIFICIFAMVYWILPILAIIIYAVRKLQLYYLISYREIVRLKRMVQGQVISRLIETVGGLQTIRVFNQEKFFMQKQAENINKSTLTKIIQIGMYNWFCQRVTFLCSLLMIILFSFSLLADFGPGIIGLIATYLVRLEKDVLALIHKLSNIESDMIGLERCLALLNIPKEEGYSN